MEDLLAQLTAPFSVSDPVPEVPCWVPIRMRSGSVGAAGRVRALLPGGLVIESAWPWARGVTVELQLQSPGVDLGPRLRGMVVRASESAFVVALPVATDEASAERVREFVLALIARATNDTPMTSGPRPQRSTR